MDNQNNQTFLSNRTPHLSDTQFEKIKALVEPEIGVMLPYSKKTLVQGRLMKRVQKLGFNGFEEYLHCIFVNGNETEKKYLLSSLTTNTTYFFRESDHFDFLAEKVLPEMVSDYQSSKRNFTFQDPLTIWSAGCSRGHEPYTIAMVVDHFLRSKSLDLEFRVLASDFSEDVLEHACRGIYTYDEISKIPQNKFKYYLMESRDKNQHLFRVIPELRRRVKFFSINFTKPEDWPTVPCEIIFCRNVLIYFNRNNQNKVLKGFNSLLKPKGYLFLGHSESIQSSDRLPMKTVFATTYKKR